MQIVHWGKARKFYKEHPTAKNPLKQWRQAVQRADWKNFSDVRKTFSSADWIEGKIVFNIKGNHFRLIALTAFNKQEPVDSLQPTERDESLRSFLTLEHPRSGCSQEQAQTDYPPRSS
mgnify:CR=1 FL=1